jgi:hypothetical protein
VSARTSAMLLPRYVTSSVFALYRAP